MLYPGYLLSYYIQILYTHKHIYVYNIYRERQRPRDREKEYLLLPGNVVSVRNAPSLIVLKIKRINLLSFMSRFHYKFPPTSTNHKSTTRVGSLPMLWYLQVLTIMIQRQRHTHDTLMNIFAISPFLLTASNKPNSTN